MQHLTYKIQTMILAAWIVIVILTFQLVPDKQVASVIAGAGFLLWPILFLMAEFRNRKNPVHVAVLILFLAGAAVPIFLMRVLNWGVEFTLLDFFGIPATFFHRSSNFLYMAVLISTIYHWRRKITVSK